ncbi:MAG: efflux RND transporter permease subunit, partial [Pseudomonadales bacterium]|nr:efflux RND transporter permease subunit [Pseudomonadales bacterium]
AADLGVSVRNIGRTLETMLGEREVTTFIDRGEEYDVILEGDENTFQSKQDLQNIFVRSERSGELIPLSNLVRVEETAASNNLIRFNRVRSFTLSAGLKEDFSLGEAIDYLNTVVKTELPGHARVGYKGVTLEFVNAGSSIVFVFGVALLIAYLVLAAQFESFIHPFIVLLTVPFALLGALMGLQYAGFTLNVYSQIGIVMLIGLAAKNGILIVEFANQLRDRGEDFITAIVNASAQRLRPIMMTAITTAVGAIPLILASEPGAKSRMVIGVVVFSGVILSTVLTLFVVPAFYTLLARGTASPGATAEQLSRELQQEPFHRTQ